MFKKNSLLLVLLLSIFLPLKVQGEDFNILGLSTRRLILSSGLEVILQYVPDCEISSIYLQVDSGARYDTDANVGRAHLLEHLLYRRTGKFANGFLSLNLENIGAKRGAKTDWESIYFWEIVPRQHLDLALQIEADRLSGLIFTDKELNWEKHNLVQEIGELSSEPLRRARMEVIERLKIPVPGGNIDDLQRLNSEDLCKFYIERFTPDRSHLTIISSQPFNLLEAKLERYFGNNLLENRQNWEKSIKQTKTSPIKLIDNRLTAEEVWQKNKINLLCLGWKLNLVNSEDYAKFLVSSEVHNLAINNLLMSDPFKEKVRYFRDESWDDKFYNLSFQLSPSIDKERFLDLLSKNIFNVDLSIAKSKAKLNFYKSWQNYSERGMWLNNSYFSEGDLNGLVSSIDKFTKDELEDFQRVNFSFKDSQVFSSPQGDSFATIYQNSSPRMVFADGGTDKNNNNSILTWTLPNGVRLAYEHDPLSPIVTSCGFLKTTGRVDLTNGSQIISQGFCWEFVSQDDGITIKGWSLKGDFVRSIESLTTFLQSLQVVEEGKVSQTNIWKMASECFFGAVFPSPRVAEKKSLVAAPQNLVLSFVGDLPDIEQIVHNIPLAGWPNLLEESGELPTLDRVKPSRIEISSEERDNNILIVAGQRGPQFSEGVEFCAYKVLLQILGGGSSSRLAVREIYLEKVARKVAGFDVVHDSSPAWVVTMVVDKDKGERALAILRQELDRLSSPGPTSEEVKRAISACQGRLQIDWSQPESRAMWLCKNLLQGKTEIDPDLYEQNFYKVTPHHVREIAQKWCRTSDWILVVEVEK